MKKIKLLHCLVTIKCFCTVNYWLQAALNHTNYYLFDQSMPDGEVNGETCLKIVIFWCWQSRNYTLHLFILLQTSTAGAIIFSYNKSCNHAKRRLTQSRPGSVCKKAMSSKPKDSGLHLYTYGKSTQKGIATASSSTASFTDIKQVC